MRKLKLSVNILLSPVSIATIFLLVFIEDPWKPINFHGFGFNLRK